VASPYAPEKVSNGDVPYCCIAAEAACRGYFLLERYDMVDNEKKYTDAPFEH
jgi:hypothetical protein